MQYIRNCLSSSAQSAGNKFLCAILYINYPLKWPRMAINGEIFRRNVGGRLQSVVCTASPHHDNNIVPILSMCGVFPDNPRRNIRLINVNEAEGIGILRSAVTRLKINN